MARTVIGSRASRLAIAVLLALIPWSPPARAGDGEGAVAIAVLAERGSERCLERWGPTAEYLSEALPGNRFTIRPFESRALLAAVVREEVDFVLTDPASYVSLELRHGASRIATLADLEMMP